MIDCVDLVQISDDENFNNIADTEQNNRNTCNLIDTIIIDEDFPINLDNNISHLKPKNKIINRISRENKLLAQFIERCLNLENSEEMIRIVQKSLLRIYYEMDERYRDSRELEKILKKALRSLELDPVHKFSHIHNLCEAMKFMKKKKRIQFITLSKNLSKTKYENRKSDRLLHRETEHNNEIINLDDECSDQYEQSNLDLTEDNINDNNEVILLDDTPGGEKENVQNGIARDDKLVEPDRRHDIEENTLLDPQIELYVDLNSSNTPMSSGRVTQQDTEAVNVEAIKFIEKQIAKHKRKIAELDEMEVHCDSNESPYIKSEKLKEKIVHLYKELCSLTGQKPVKYRTVRLQVLEGHPPGPVSRLETFINDNIGEDGDPHFPDFCDVVQCVRKANVEDKLGWNKAQIIKEANSLFTQCGRALQKRRQQREYRDLLSKVKIEQGDSEPPDPAEGDTQLLAKLEENRRLAVKKEDELLESYTRLQDQPPRTHLQPTGESSMFQFMERNDEDSAESGYENSDHETDVRSGHIVKVGDESGNSIANKTGNSCNSTKESGNRANDSNMDSSDENMKSEFGHNCDNTEIKEPEDVINLLQGLGNNFTATVFDIESPILVIEISSDSSDDEIMSCDD